MTALKKVVTAVVVGVLVSTAMFGCNTVRGMGKDVQRSGEAVEDAAEGAQRK